MSVLIIFLCALACIVSGGGHPYMAFHAVDVGREEYDITSCPGVVISDQHILTTLDCLSSKRNGIVHLANQFGVVKRVLTTRLNPDNRIKAASCSHRFEHSLAIIKLRDKLNSTEAVPVYLPTRNILPGDNGVASGLAGACNSEYLQVRDFPVTVTDRQSCPDLRPDEICVEQRPELNLIRGAPIVNEYNFLFGFTTFGCSGVEGAVLNVFPYVDWIRKMIN